MREQDRNASAIARIATAGKGIVTRADLLAAGLSAAAIDRRLHNGTLFLEYPGVYRVGHRAPSTEASYLAAVKACGPGAVLCGLAAAWLWGLIKGRPPPTEVAAPTERRIKGIRTHRRRLHRSDRGRRHAIPITTVPLTLIDITPLLPISDLARACHEAGVKYHATPRHVEQALARRPNAPSAAKLRHVLRGEVHVSLSRLEERFLELLREAGLPIPITNKPAGSHRVDCRWPEHKLTVELGSYRFHNSRHSWEQDGRREREARARGDDFARYTWGDVFERPGPMLRELRGLLADGYQR